MILVFTLLILCVSALIALRPINTTSGEWWRPDSSCDRSPQSARKKPSSCTLLPVSTPPPITSTCERPFFAPVYLWGRSDGGGGEQ